jgi:1-acyl-sn-glycerol-3-phosphate acyltransferase
VNAKKKKIRPIYWIVQNVAKGFLYLFFHPKFENFDRLKGLQSVIIASNHNSWFDPPFYGGFIPSEIAFLAKAELFKNKLFGWFIRTLNTIPIVRGKPDVNAISTAIRELESGKSLLIFPEGTRRGKTIKPGVGLFAIKTKCDIIPVYIENSDKFWQCAFFLCRVRIIIGEPIKVEYFEGWTEQKESYQKLAEYVYNKIMELKN